MNRRRALALAAAPFLNIGRYRLSAQTPRQYSARAVDLVKSSVVMDMLSPFRISGTQSRALMQKPETFGAAELEPFRASGITAFHIAVGVGGADAYLSVLQFVSSWNSFLAHHSETLKRIDAVADLDAAKKLGKVGVLLGIQNSDHFRRPDDVDFFFSLGQRISQLTYNARNLIGNGSTERRDEGLSDFGLRIVERMNQAGMAVDVSHCGDRTTLDAFDASSKPVLITHSNSRTVAGGHPRCKSDEAIRKMAAKGGVMGITSVRMFVKNAEPTTLDSVLDHYDHVRKLAGPEFLGIGSDIDLWGYDAMPAAENRALRAAYKAEYAFRDKIDIEGLDHPRRVFDLTEGLLRRGYSDADIRGILGGNFRRVLGQIWPS